MLYRTIYFYCIYINPYALISKLNLCIYEFLESGTLLYSLATSSLMISESDLIPITTQFFSSSKCLSMLVRVTVLPVPRMPVSLKACSSGISLSRASTMLSIMLALLRYLVGTLPKLNGIWISIVHKWLTSCIYIMAQQLYNSI